MIFVTGGTGLVGTHLLIELLVRGKEVRALKRESSDIGLVREIFKHYGDTVEKLFDQIDWVDGDILDIISLEDAMTGCSEVYHCAGFVSFDRKDRKLLRKINVEGTANVINTAIDLEIEKFCHVSSTSAVGKIRGEELTSEGAPSNRNINESYYSWSKYGAEREAWRGAEEGLNMVIVNPAVVLGPGNWNESSSVMFKAVHDGVNYYPPGMNGIVDARDVASAMVELMEAEVFNDRFLLVGENVTFKDLLSTVAKSLDKNPPQKLATKKLLKTAYVFESIRTIFGGKPRITKDTIRSSNRVAKYSSEKIKSSVDFSFKTCEQAVENAGSFFLKRIGSGVK